MIDIRAMPVYLDGSDGSLWASRDAWEDIFTVEGLAERRFVRVSDLLLWLESNQIPTMDLTELLKLSILRAGKSKEAASSLALSCVKTESSPQEVQESPTASEENNLPTL